MKRSERKPGNTGILPVQTRRYLPHWEMGGSTYFITFRTREIELSTETRHIVLDACRHFDGRRYRLWAATVMPDHEHVLLTPIEKSHNEWFSLSSILHSLKSFTAKEINRLLARRGPLWMEESFDRIGCGEREFIENWQYIRNNPVKRGLCLTPEEWPWLYESAARDFI
jgi:putative transposase